MELTKKEFEQILDQKISKLVTKDDLGNILDHRFEKQSKLFDGKLDTAIKASEKRIIARIDEAQEELARITNAGFDDVIERINKVDVRHRTEKLELDMKNLKAAVDLN